jgi:hypothetical protein
MCMWLSMIFFGRPGRPGRPGKHIAHGPWTPVTNPGHHPASGLVKGRHLLLTLGILPHPLPVYQPWLGTIQPKLVWFRVAIFYAWDLLRMRRDSRRLTVGKSEECTLETHRSTDGWNGSKIPRSLESRFESCGSCEAGRNHEWLLAEGVLVFARGGILSLKEKERERERFSSEQEIVKTDFSRKSILGGV